jgi:hypothetical protein
VLSPEEERGMRSSIETLKKAGILSELGVSEEEKVMIVKAMGFTAGHWFKCPNGKSTLCAAVWKQLKQVDKGR